MKTFLIVISILLLNVAVIANQVRLSGPVRVDLHMLEGAIPCAVASGNGSLAISCKWDHVEVTSEDDEETPEPSSILKNAI